MLLTAAALVDVDRRRIPNWLTGIGFAGLFAAIGLIQLEAGLDLVPPALAGAVLFAGPLLVVHAVTHAHTPGLGDIKLAGSAGLMCGAFDARLALPALVVSCLAGGVFGMAWHRRTGEQRVSVRAGDRPRHGACARVRRPVRLAPDMRPRSALAVVAMLVVLVACSDDDDAAAPPVPTASTDSTSESSAESETTPQSTSTIPESTTSELNPVPTTPPPPSTTTIGTVALPPVPTLVPQVPDELLTPEQRDPFNVNNSRPILPEHVPVIEAHLRALQASTFVASNRPLNPDAPELVGAPFTPDALRRAQGGIREALDANEVLNVTQGVTFRPYAVEVAADRAVVLDCEIAGHYWTDVDSGEALPPDDIWPAGPGRIVEVGLREELVLRDGAWLVDSSRIDSGACA